MIELSPNRQRNAVSEGIAFGVILNGYRSIASDKYLIDLAVRNAWRK